MPCKNITNNSNLDLKPHQNLFDAFFPYSQEKLGYDKPFSLNFASDEENHKNPLGKTAHYNPSSYEVTIYTDGRHIKDILRSLSHELVHHAQNCRGEFGKGLDTSPGYAQEDGHLRNMEKEAYLKGNLLFRDWEDNYKQTFMENKTMKKLHSIIRKVLKEELNKRNNLDEERVEKRQEVRDPLAPSRLKEMVRKELRKVLSEAHPYNQAVYELQAFLKRKGYDLGRTGPKRDGVDGELGKKTRAAMKALALPGSRWQLNRLAKSGEALDILRKGAEIAGGVESDRERKVALRPDETPDLSTETPPRPPIAMGDIEQAAEVHELTAVLRPVKQAGKEMTTSEIAQWSAGKNPWSLKKAIEDVYGPDRQDIIAGGDDIDKFYAGLLSKLGLLGEAQLRSEVNESKTLQQKMLKKLPMYKMRDNKVFEMLVEESTK